MTEKKPIIIDGVDVSACERHCMDNYNTPNRCYSDMTESYRDCRPKENQCNFYITSIEQQLARKTQECERKDKEIYELHIIIDRLLEASGYDKNTSTAEDFEDVYENMRYKQGLLDQLKAENEELKIEIQKQSKSGAILEYDLRALIDRLKAKNVGLENEITEIQKLKDEDRLKVAELATDLQRLNTDNYNLKTTQEFLTKQLEKRVELLKKAEQKLERIKQICNTKQKHSVYVFKSIWEQILQIIDEVK